jgi:hypothetical protein
VSDDEVAVHSPWEIHPHFAALISGDRCNLPKAGAAPRGHSAGKRTQKSQENAAQADL